MAIHFIAYLKKTPPPPDALSLILLTCTELEGLHFGQVAGFYPDSGGRLVGRDLNITLTLHLLSESGQAPGAGREQTMVLTSVAPCSGRSQQWIFSPSASTPGYTSCGGTNPKSDGFVHTPAILPFTLQHPASLAS